MDYTNIDLHRLKAVACRLIDELATEIGSSSFRLPENDFYWQIDFAAKMNIATAPTDFTIGRLRDDWEMTCTLCDEPTNVSAYSLTELAELLSYMGERVVQKS